MKCRNISNSISSPQIKVRIIPRFSKKEPEQLSFYFLKDLGKVKQDWRLKLQPYNQVPVLNLSLTSLS